MKDLIWAFLLIVLGVALITFALVSNNDREWQDCLKVFTQAECEVILDD